MLPFGQTSPRKSTDINSELLHPGRHFSDTNDSSFSRKSPNPALTWIKGFTLFQIFAITALYLPTIIVRLFALDIPRLNNAGLNPLWLVFLFVPFLGLVVRVALLFAPPKEISDATGE